MTGIRPYHAAVLALLAAALTVQPAEPNPMPKVSASPPPSVSVKPGNIPRPPNISGPVNTGTRGGTDAASRGTNSPSGNEGSDGGKGSGPGSAAPGAGGPSAEVAAQQAVVDKAYADSQNYYYKDLLPMWSTGVVGKASDDELKADLSLVDARKLHQEMRDRYLSDPTAENDALVKTAEQAILAAEKQLDVMRAKYDEALKRTELARKQAQARYDQMWNQYQKEADKLNALKVKHAQTQPAVDTILDNLLSP